MSDPEFEHASPKFLQARSDSWSRTPAIVYDSIEGRLYRLPEAEAKALSYPTALLPGTSTKADVYLEIDRGADQGVDLKEEKEKAKAWLAKVDLGKLGWTARWKRRKGEIKYIYIKKGRST